MTNPGVKSNKEDLPHCTGQKEKEKWLGKNGPSLLCSSEGTAGSLFLKATAASEPREEKRGSQRSGPKGHLLFSCSIRAPQHDTLRALPGQPCLVLSLLMGTGCPHFLSLSRLP